MFDQHVRPPPPLRSWMSFGLSLALSACTRGPSEPPTAPATPASENSERADATNELTPQSQVTFAGIGPIQIGMTVAEAEAAANIELVVRYFDYAGTGEPSRCAYARPTAGPPELALMVIEGRSTRVDISYLTRQEVDGQPVAVEVESSQITTPEGIGLWTSEADVSAAYPEAEITLHPYVEGHCLTVIDPNPPYHSLIFETNADQGNQVMNFRSGRSPEVQWIEGCS